MAACSTATYLCDESSEIWNPISGYLKLILVSAFILTLFWIGSVTLTTEGWADSGDPGGSELEFDAAPLATSASHVNRD